MRSAWIVFWLQQNAAVKSPSGRPPAPFDPLRILATLQRHDVRFVIIGAFAGRLLGSPTVTRDVDICYARDAQNHAALAAALQELNARLRGVGEDVPFRLDARTIAAGDSFTFETDAGDLDILGTPSGTSGYEELKRTAETLELDGISARVASIDALLAMKRAAGRRKDLIEAEILEALREEIERG